MMDKKTKTKKVSTKKDNKNDNLQKAIVLHQKHMDNPKTATEASQKRMMQLMQAAQKECK